MDFEEKDLFITVTFLFLVSLLGKLNTNLSLDEFGDFGDFEFGVFGDFDNWVRNLSRLVGFMPLCIPRFATLIGLLVLALNSGW